MRPVDGVHAHGLSRPPVLHQGNMPPPQTGEGGVSQDPNFIRPDLRQLYLAVEEAATAHTRRGVSSHEAGVEPPLDAPPPAWQPPLAEGYKASHTVHTMHTSGGVLSATAVLQRQEEAAANASQPPPPLASVPGQGGAAFADLLSEAFRRLSALENTQKLRHVDQEYFQTQSTELAERCEQLASAHAEGDAALKRVTQAAAAARESIESRQEHAERLLKEHSGRFTAVDKQLLQLLQETTDASEEQQHQQVALDELRAGSVQLSRALSQLTVRFDKLEKEHAAVKSELETAQGRLKRMTGIAVQRGSAPLPTVAAPSPAAHQGTQQRHTSRVPVSPASISSEQHAIDSLKRDINGEVFAALSACNIALPVATHTSPTRHHRAAVHPAASPPSPVRVSSHRPTSAPQWGSPPGGSRAAHQQLASPGVIAASAAVRSAEANLRATPGFMGGGRPASPGAGLTDADELRAVLDELQKLM